MSREQALADALQLVLDDWANANAIGDDAREKAEAALSTAPEARLNEQLLFVYESILTEMRKFAPQNETIGGWVRRLDFARDEAGVSPPRLTEGGGPAEPRRD